MLALSLISSLERVCRCTVESRTASCAVVPARLFCMSDRFESAAVPPAVSLLLSGGLFFLEEPLSSSPPRDGLETLRDRRFKIDVLFIRKL